MSLPPSPPPNPTHSDDEHTWQQLAVTWQDDKDNPMTAQALQHLEHSVFDSSKKQRRNVVIEIAASLFVALFWIDRILDKPSEINLTLGLVSIVFIVVWLGALMHNLRGTWEPAGLRTHEYLLLVRRRFHADLRWSKIANILSIGLGTAILVWAAWVWWMTDLYDGKLGSLLLGVGCIWAILGGVIARTVWVRRKKRAELAAFEESVAPLLENDPPTERNA